MKRNVSSDMHGGAVHDAVPGIAGFVSTGLHREDVRLSVVTDGDRFEGAWGAAPDADSLTEANWVESNRGEAFYSDPAARNGSLSVAALPPSRRRAVCLWRSAATP